MQLTDIHVIQQTHDWLNNNKTVWLCTILATYGSAPRPIGSIFATDGNIRAGSISGGCLEDAFIDLINQGRFNKSSEVFVYGNHSNDDNLVKELPCGGTIRLLVERIQANEQSINYLQHWLNVVQQAKAFCRTIDIGSATLHEIECLNDECQNAVIETNNETENTITLNYAQVFSLLIVGIGQVSEDVAKLGLMSGFDVKICDMRRELASSWQFDKQRNGIDVTWMSPDLFIEKFANKRSAVLALAHDPKIDDTALMSVFDSQAFYIGAMGSTRTTAKRVERLQRICDINESQLKRLHAPIGLNIGSKTPMEIAISIMADVIRCRHNIAKDQL